MTDTLNIKLQISSSDLLVPLGLEVWVDSTCVTALDHVNETVNVCYELDDTDGNHELRVVLKNKKPEHTQIDDQGNITKDAVLTIDRVEFGGIEISDLFIKNSEYYHSFNDTGEPTVSKCYQQMGCNGAVTLKFASPFYLWLLETI